MESENSGTPRLTRARGRRLSENRPMTPILDVPGDRGSPRQTRRSRMNSTTAECRTPMRTTRGSVARGETPEPVITPLKFTSVRRTPSKSVKKQLTLPEELNEEQPQSAERQVEKKDESRSMTPILNAPVDPGSEQQTPGSGMNSTRAESGIPIQTSRGETPEPMTPTLSLKEGRRRIPSKSVNKQLTLPEELNEKQPQTSERGDEKKDESRPMTPILDVPIDSGSTQQTPGSRMNSTTAECRTPTRTTRGSVARGETPEPVITPQNFTGVRRTPSKSVKKELILPEEPNEDQPPTSEREDDKKDESRPMTPILNAPVDPGSERQTPGSGMNSTRAESGIPVLTMPEELNEKQPQTSEQGDEKKVESRPMTPILDVPIDSGSEQQTPGSRKNSTRAESGTPIRTNSGSVARGATPEPVIPPLYFTDEERPQASERRNEKVKLASVADTDEMVGTPPMSKTPPVKHASPLKNDIANSTEESAKQKQVEDTGEMLESPLNNSIHIEESLNTASMDAKQLIGRVSKVKVKVKDILAEEKRIVIMDANELKPSGNNEATVASDKKHSEVKDSLKHSDSSTDTQITADVQEVIHSEDLTPNAKTPSKLNLSAKVVRFTNKDLLGDIMKTKYPKTPARVRSPVDGIITISGLMNGTPLNRKVVKGRNSSTPLAKVELTTSHAKEASEESNPPPVQIDTIKPLSQIENTDPIPLPLEKTEEQPNNPVSDDEIEDDNESNQADSVCEFFDNEVEVVNNYQSGDSMDSVLRKEIEENEIQDDGESVGSQDTIDNNSEDSADEKMSFIVSDNDLDGNDNDIESLCFSSESESGTETPDKEVRKQRRRIIVHDSSDENDQIEDTKESNKEAVESRKNPEISAIQVVDELPQKKSPRRSVCVALEEKNSRKSVRLNETVEEIVISSSNENEDEGKNKNSSGNHKNIYEVIDSDEESTKSDGSDDEHIDLTEPTQYGPDSISQEEHPGKPLNENNLISCDSPIADGSANQSNVVNKHNSSKLTAEGSSPSSGSLKCYVKRKRDEEAVLLDEIATCDLSHMRQMFNPLQKTRRQTLFGQDLKTREQEPRLKLKRRSEEFGSDVKPSQSFIESLANEPITKRSRLSKSFCGAVDGLDTSMEVGEQAETPSDINGSKSEVSDIAMDEAVESIASAPEPPEAELSVETAVSVKSEVSLKVVEASGAGESEEAVSPVEVVEAVKEGSPYCTDTDKRLDHPKNVSPVVEVQVQNDTVRSSRVHLIDHKLTASNPMSQQAAPEQELESQSSIDNVSQEKLALANVRETVSEEEEDEVKPKSRDKYLEYCENLIQAANEAKLEQKIQRIGAGKVQKNSLNLKKSTPDNADAASILKTKKPPMVKKNVKRLQATKHAVRHAIQLLAPDVVNSEAQSLARKLSLQPKANMKSSKANIPKRKQHKLMNKESPVKSSDEENHREPKRIKNRAGYVTIECNTEPKLIKKFKTSSSIVKVEPCTPIQKYFKEIPQSPINYGFKELPATPTHKKKSSSIRNPATESALRFKRQIFGKCSK